MRRFIVLSLPMLVMVSVTMLNAQSDVEYVIRYDDGVTAYYSGRPQPYDTCGIWFEPQSDSQILTAQFQFNGGMGGDAYVYVWYLSSDFDPDSYYDSDEPNASPGPSPIGELICGPFVVTFEGGEWEEINFEEFGVPPEDLDVGTDPFIIGYVLVGCGAQPYYPSILGDAEDDRPYHSLAWLTDPQGGYPGWSGWWAYGIDWTLRARMDRYGPEPPPYVAVDLYPPVEPIVIPAQGGQFSFDLFAENNTTAAQMVEGWCEIRLPDGTIVGPTIGPALVTVPEFSTNSYNRAQTVPAFAPIGIYTYQGYIGEYPNIIWHSDSFTFEKVGSSLGGGIQDWTSYGDLFGESLDKRNKSSLRDGAVSISVSPNPFNPCTTLRFDLPEDSKMSLKVYDLQGRRVATLVDGMRKAGSHEVTFDASNLASGIYLYRLTAGSFEASGKMVLVK